MDEQDYEKFSDKNTGMPYIRDLKSVVKKMYKEAINPEKKLGKKTKKFKPYTLNDISYRMVDLVASKPFFSPDNSPINTRREVNKLTPRISQQVSPRRDVIQRNSPRKVRSPSPRRKNLNTSMDSLEAPE